jgi:hypothetical protein
MTNFNLRSIVILYNRYRASLECAAGRVFYVKVFLFKISFLIFLDYFNVLILKI